MAEMLVVTGVDAPEAPLGLDVTLMFDRLGLAEGRNIRFYAVQDNKGVHADWLAKRKPNKAYREVDTVLASRMPCVVIDLHHAFVSWDHYEIHHSR